MATPLAHPERIAIARLHALLELLPTALDRHLAPAGITSFEYTLLETLAEAPGHALRLSALASRTNATLPRLSRVVSSLEKRRLVERLPCAEDGRATNAVLTESGAQTQQDAAPLYAEGARRLILDGLQSLPGDGVQQLTDLSYAVLSVLDPEHRLSVTAQGAPCTADPDRIATPCSADPDPQPAPAPCAADPAVQPEAATACPADPTAAIDPAPCAADPAVAPEPTAVPEPAASIFAASIP